MSTQEVYNYRVYCTVEADYVYTWGTVEPTNCPNNAAHAIDSNLTAIVETVTTTTIKTIENTDGYFETTHIVVNIPSGTPGDITTYDVTWPMSITLWKTELKPTSDMIGDSITVIGSPETTVGVLTSAASIGATTINVNSTVTDNVWRGFLITLDDTVNKDVVGRCTAVDPGAGTISFQTPLSFNYAIGTPVKIGIYVLKDINIVDTDVIGIGNKGFKGKEVPAGTILRIYYTNNSGTAKTIRYRPEYYSNR